VNSSIRSLKEERDFKARDDEQLEIASVVHALRDQACTLGLGISALQYPDESEEERQHHLSVLERVVEDMNREFQRLDHWLMQVGYKQQLAEPARMGRRRRIKRQSVRA
jgi:hypothetical protein